MLQKMFINPLWSELRLYGNIVSKYVFLLTNLVRLQEKLKKSFLPITVKICRRGQNLTSRSNLKKYSKFLFPTCFALIFKF